MLELEIVERARPSLGHPVRKATPNGRKAKQAVSVVSSGSAPSEKQMRDTYV
jgi:hypothetical protein